MTIELPEGVEPQILFTVVGLALSLFGWLIFRIGTRLASLVFGVAIGFFLGEVAVSLLDLQGQAATFATLGAMVLLGIAALFAIKALSNFLFAVVGLLFGALAGRMGADFYAAYSGQPFADAYTQPGIVLVSGIVGALLTVWLQRLIMIVATSYMGATFLVAGVEALQTRDWALPALFFGGIVWQAYVMRRIFREKRASPPVNKPPRAA